MKRALYIAIIIIATTLCSCNSLKKIEAQAYPISYTELQNYFVLNDMVGKKAQNVIIDNEQQFRRYFGDAAVMGRNGMPTHVDFKTQYVLAVILPVTNRATVVIPGEISQVGNTVIVNYSVRKGSKQSYSVIPFAAVAIDKPATDSEIEFYFNRK